jgi:cytochrome c-type protein NapB
MSARRRSATGRGLLARVMRGRAVLAIGCLAAFVAFAADQAIDGEPPPATADALGTGLRGPAPLNEEPQAPRMARVENFDIRRGRAYTSQPPTIPHAIEKYEITRNVNFCMFCHARVRSEMSQAPMVSATHYMDRDHDYLAEISPRRYFCTQCHVVQTDAKPLVGNEFLDVDALLEREHAAERDERRGGTRETSR